MLILQADIKGTSIDKLAADLADPKWLGENNESSQNVMNWADKQEKLGKITPQQAQDIRNNVGNQRDAQQALKDAGHADKKEH